MLSVPMALVTAGSAFAAATCQSSVSPINVNSEVSLKVACLVDVSATASLNTNHLEIHDALNAAWHRGAAQTVTVTTAVSTTLTFAAGTIQTRDVNRPISGTGIAATAFIRSVSPAACTATCTSAILSQPSTAAATITATIEHTTARIVKDASYTAGATSTLTSATGGFATTDVNKGVSGAGFKPGSRISSRISATQVVVTPGAATALATSTGEVTFGAVQYTAVSPSTVTTYTDANTREVGKTTNVPAGTASCATSTLTITAAGGGTNLGDIGLKVSFINSAGAVVATSAVTARPTATTDTISPACPTTAPGNTWTEIAVGEPGANAPHNGATVASLTSALNLNNALNATSDNCNTNTYEGFGIAGDWNNPGAYQTTGVFGVPSEGSVAQVLYPTSVVSFAAYVVPKASDTHVAGPHFDVIFPTLPTSLAVCPIVAGTTTTHTGIDFGFLSTTLSTAPFLPTGSGNPGSPGVRQVGPAVGLFGEKVSLFNGSTQLGVDIAPTGCTFIASTATPAFTCGLG
jgi:hypothetical protein